MDQQTTAKKLIESLKLQHSISRDFEILLSHYFELAYAVGYDAKKVKRGTGNNSKIVGRYSVDGMELLQTYSSAANAGRCFGLSHKTISKSIIKKRTTCGFVWRYLEK